MSLEEMEASGQLEALACTQAELAKLLTAARRWLADADVEAVSDQGRYESAYNAVLACALAALRANDYRVYTHEGKHVITLDSCAFIRRRRTWRGDRDCRARERWLRFSPPNVPRLQEVAVNGSVLVFTLFLCVLVSILFGLPPALQAANSTSTSGFD